MTPVGIIETGRPSQKITAQHGDFADMVIQYLADQRQLRFSVFSVLNGKPLPPVDACQSWVLTGSSHAVYDKLSWIIPFENFLRTAAERLVPVLGICFGHQLMAQAYGGKVEKASRGRGIGMHRYTLTQPGKRLLGNAAAFNLAAAHQDQIVVLPEGATRLASSPFCPNAALAYGNHGLSFQGHPEFTPKIERAIIEGWQKRDPAPRAIYRAAMETLDRMPPDARRLAPALGRFLAGGGPPF
jgi:GMP synthase (glutamine-hydrolysing)